MEPKLYKVLRPIITLFFKLIYNPKISGLENIKDGRLVLAGNHTNNLDCLLLISCTKRVIHFLAKDELEKSKFKFIFKNMGLIFVNRRQKDPNSLNKSIEYLKNDKLIGIFPEGTINRTKDKILPFKYGAVKMANVTDSYITPFIIKGKYKPFGGISITFLKPYKVNEDLEKENKKLEQIISKNL